MEAESEEVSTGQLVLPVMGPTVGARLPDMRLSHRDREGPWRTGLPDSLHSCSYYLALIGTPPYSPSQVEATSLEDSSPFLNEGFGVIKIHLKGNKLELNLLNPEKRKSGAGSQ